MVASPSQRDAAVAEPGRGMQNRTGGARANKAKAARAEVRAVCATAATSAYILA
jgi:hypothetical protein